MLIQWVLPGAVKSASPNIMDRIDFKKGKWILRMISIWGFQRDRIKGMDQVHPKI